MLKKLVHVRSFPEFVFKFVQKVAEAKHRFNFQEIIAFWTLDYILFKFLIFELLFDGSNFAIMISLIQKPQRLVRLLLQTY